MSMESLSEFIESNPDPRELKRALAVRMTLPGYIHQQIMEVLEVSSGFISKWKLAFLERGVEGLKLAYRGSQGYLSDSQHEQVMEWLKSQNRWNLNELEFYIAETFDVVFASRTSYYELFHAAGINWKKTQGYHPKKDPQQVEARRQEITAWLEARREPIESGKLIVLFVDECHLLWGDVCGYVWGKSHIRIEVPIENERERQTYFGALNDRTNEFLIKSFPTANSDTTIEFMTYLQAQYPDSQIVIFWDGASYHRSHAVQNFLVSVNEGKREGDWELTCMRLAPYAPDQNPVETVWLAGKRQLRESWHLCRSFRGVKWLFEWFLERCSFTFPQKSFLYGSFS